MTKICFECKHCVRQPGSGNHECHRNAYVSKDVVTGAPVVDGMTVCRNERNNMGTVYCGPDARFWEAQSE